ncbi:MAG: hypothetical protein ABSD73_05705 [Candidatus Bathyarchaeia archaeon]
MRKLSDLLPKMPCRTLCGHPLQRYHWSCMYCRVRRFFYGKMDPKIYHYNSLMRLVVPADQTTYVLFIDDRRRNAKVKSILLKACLELAEWLAN